jgi:hypothetical protein
VLPACIPEKPARDTPKPGSVKAAAALLGSVKGTSGNSKSKPAPAKPETSKPAEAKPDDALAKIQYSAELEPGKGKSKLSGQMLQGWI